jgi:hypothetical protein
LEKQVINAELVSQSESQLVNDRLAWLSDSEKYALDYFRKSFQKGGASTYAIAPSTQAQLFVLYLNGRSLNEIRILNHPNFNLGQIVAAAVDNDWEGQKREYSSGLMQKARERFQQVGCESLAFLGDTLSAAHKMHGDAMARYLQSGNPADLGAFTITNIRQYKEVLELLLKASGQDKTTNLNVKGVVEHISTPTSSGDGNKTLSELAATKKEIDLSLMKREDDQESRRRHG